MPIFIEYVNGRQDAVEGESWKQLDEATTGRGQVYLKDLNDGHRIIVVKSNVVRVHEIPEDVWKAGQEAKGKAEKQKAIDATAAWDALPWWKKIGKKAPAVQVRPSKG